MSQIARAAKRKVARILNARRKVAQAAGRHGLKIRRNDEKEIDEIFVRGADHIRVEHFIDTCWFIHVTSKDGNGVMIRLWTEGSAPILCSIEDE